MSVVADIIESWHRPRFVVRRHLSRPRSEAFVFTFLLVFLLASTIAQAPVAAREVALTAEPLLPRLFPRFLAVLATIPLWYGIAGLGLGAARVFGVRADFYGARLALFWALVAIVPGVLLFGLVGGMILGASLLAVGLAVFGGFAFQWIMGLREVGRTSD